MPRPFLCRTIEQVPTVTFFKPQGVPLRDLEVVRLALDELEAMRLVDLDGLYQEEAAVQMGVSRPTLGRILESARRKVSLALLEGKALRLEGGPCVLSTLPERPGFGRGRGMVGPWDRPKRKSKLNQGGSMKIALPTEDGTHIGDHFGPSPNFLVFTVEDGQVHGKELLRNEHAKGEHGHGGEGGHGDILAALADCQVVIAHGMGPRAVRDLEASGLEVCLTTTVDAEEAVQLYLSGQLPNATGGCQSRCK
jgi:predicted DNA-binding protein (UPF0251 family)/predicted Fe-Mo cluster-binding NifX family protein